MPLTATEKQQLENLIFYTATNRGIPQQLALFMVSQARHETGIYTSNAFNKNKNLFGYKRYAGSKWQIGSGITSSEGDAYANYRTYEDSVNEIVDWLNRRVREGKFPILTQVKTYEQYATLLKNAGYYGDTVSNYLAGLIRHAATLIHGNNPFPAIFIIGLVALYVYAK